MKNSFTLFLVLSTLTVFAQKTSLANRKIVKDGYNTFITDPLLRNLKQEKLQPSLNKVEQLFDSIFDWRWDTTAIAWKLSSRFANLAYDARNNFISGTYQDLVGTSWVDTHRYKVFYDAANNDTLSITEIWDGAAWINGEKTYATFDINKNTSSAETIVWNGSAWENGAKYFYKWDSKNNPTEQMRQQGNGNLWENDFIDYTTYDSTGNVITKGRQLWDTAKSAWVNSRQDYQTYDANNLLVHSAVQSWKNNAWETGLEFIYTYDSKNNLSSEILTAYGGFNQRRKLYSYDTNNNLLQEIQQSWTGSAWSSNGQYVNVYDSNNNRTDHTFQTWNGISWISAYISLDVFDQDNFFIAESTKSLNTTGTKVVKGDSSFYYYHTAILGIPELALENNKLSVYPNPSPGNFNVVLDNNATITKLEVYNMQGALIRVENTKQLNLKGEVAGVYLLKVTAGNIVYIKRILLE